MIDVFLLKVLLSKKSVSGNANLIALWIMKSWLCSSDVYFVFGTCGGRAFLLCVQASICYLCCITDVNFCLFINITSLEGFKFVPLSWQLAIMIRAVIQGHIPQTNFIFVTMGSTAVLLVGWRALLFSIFSNEKTNKNDDYRRGSPFELFEVCFLNIDI